MAASQDCISEDVRKFMRLVGQTAVDKCDVDQLQADPGIHFVKTHDLPNPEQHPAIVLVRDGRDSVVSYAHFRLKTEQNVDHPTREAFEEMLKDLITGDTFGGWSANVSAWVSQVDPESVIRYEDLIHDPEKYSARALRRLGIRAEANGPAPSFHELHATVPWFFRKGKSGSWQHEMPKQTEQLFLEQHGHVMTELGYL